jgi:glycosyltransferase involved in cell wall biosynthesis
MKKISVIIPAHNEELYITKCLKSIKRAESLIDIPVEIVVVLNRCTDRTEKIAKSFGAICATEDEKNIGKIRNTGVSVSTGDILITIDSDSWMSENMLEQVLRKLKDGRYIGGGVRIKLERLSIGIIFSLLMIAPYLLKNNVSAGMFWLFRKDFEEIGGFDERRISTEDVHFARRLKSYGKNKGLQYGTIRKAHIITSCRKFDQFGDWYLFKNPKIVKDIFDGKNQKAVDKFYYKTGR